jgi:hypothetical protein
MPLITPQEALDHVRGNPLDAASLALFARSAERAAMQFLNRNVYATQEEFDAAIPTADALETVAEAEYADARVASYASTAARDRALWHARYLYNARMEQVREIREGMVIVEDVKVAMLLIMAHLFRNREEVTSENANQIPMGARTFLWPYRRGLGV